MGKPTDLQVTVELEKSKLNRQKSLLLIDKAMLLYMAFLFVGIMGFVNNLLNLQLLNLLVMLGIGVLLIGIVPYVLTMQKEESHLNSLLTQLKGGRG